MPRIGRFQLEDRILGDSAAGLWRAHDELLDRTVTIRVVPHSDPRHDTLRAAACAAAGVVDRHVAQVLDVLDRDDATVIVAEWVEGFPLEQVLGQPMASQEAVQITRNVAAAVASIHAAGGYHGRLRPASVMISSEGEVRLRGHCIDAALWGIEPGPDGVAADLHGVGAILMACLTTRWPGVRLTGLRSAPVLGGRVATPNQLRADVPQELNDIVVRALAAVPSSRPPACAHPFADIAELREALAVLADTGPQRVLTGSQPPPTAPVDRSSSNAPIPQRPSRTWARRTGGLVAAAAVVAMLALVGSGLFFPQTDSNANSAAAAPEPAPSIEHRSAHTSPTRVSDAAAVGTPAAVERPLLIHRVSSFNPRNGHIEEGGFANFAIDQNLATAWYTDRYKRHEFANGAGTGLVVDLGSPQPIRSLQLTLVGNDTDLEIRTSNRMRTDPGRYRMFTRLSGVPTTVTVREPRPVTARYVLILLKAVPYANAGYQGGIAAVSVRG